MHLGEEDIGWTGLYSRARVLRAVLGGEGEEPVIRWSLPGDDQEVRPGSCAPGQPRACVTTSGSMTLSYVHPEERGVYTCLAYNNQGNDSREVHLEVKVCSRVI